VSSTVPCTEQQARRSGCRCDPSAARRSSTCSVGSAAACRNTLVGSRSQTRTGIPALPSCHLVLIGLRPKPKGYPNQLNTLGDHIRQARLDRGLHLDDVADQIGVTGAMVSLWETNRAVPTVSKTPRIIQFLGFTPYRQHKGFGEWLKLVRTSRGYSQRKLASLFGGDQRSVREWERGIRKPTKRSILKLRAILRTVHTPSIPVAETIHQRALSQKQVGRRLPPNLHTSQNRTSGELGTSTVSRLLRPSASLDQ